MKTNLFLFVFAAMALSGCASHPNHAENVDTQLEKSAAINGTERIGVRDDGNVVVQRKVLLSEDLRNLEIDVYSTEDRIYGNRKYGSLGLYGVLKECRKNLVDRRHGGTGKLMWTEPINRVTENEPEFKIGVDEKNDLVTITEEMIKDRIARFQKYQTVLRSREDDYQDKIDICQAELKSRNYDAETSRTE